MDTDRGELDRVTATFAAMAEAGRSRYASDRRPCGGLTGSRSRRRVRQVIAAEVLEHLPADQTAMNEIARVLRRRRSDIDRSRVAARADLLAALDEYHNNEGGHSRIFTRRELVTKLTRSGLTVGGHHHAQALHSPYWWVKCAVGVHADDHPMAREIHKILVWDIMRKPAITQLADRALNPLIGKSLVVYADKHAAAR
jgi:hypothetical protein